MKKLLVLILIIVICVALYFFLQNKNLANQDNTTTKQQVTAQDSDSNSDTQDIEEETEDENDADEVEEIIDTEEEVDVRPAVDVYKSADEALTAVRKAALSYDDAVLEQFYMIGNCAWCTKFYEDVKGLMNDKSLSNDERGYYAELLSTTGKKENIESLVSASLNSKDETEKDIFTEALELSNLSNESLNYLKEEYKNLTDEDVKEATMAAISNQGTKDAIEILYDITKSLGDANGFYDQGIGLGEVVPEDSAFPILDEIASKRDEYSHLAIKAMLNGGIEGTKRVIDILANSKDPQGDIKGLDLEKAADHVLFDDETKAYLEGVQNPNEAQKYFIDEVIKIAAESMKDE